MDLTQFDGHTPGPWQCILNNPLAHGDVVTSEGEVVARIRGWGWLQKLPDGAAQQDANGRLVAAAPDLLAEVRRLTAEADALRRERDEAAEVAKRWRSLALQIDLHRMQAMWHLNALIVSPGHADAASAFLATPPTPGAEIAAKLDELTAERDELAAWKAETEQAEPVAWIERITGRLAAPTDEHRTRFPMVYRPLIDRPAPAAAPELADIVAAERERWKRIAENAQAVTTGGDDKGDYFEVPSHLIAALALALDEGFGAQGQAGAEAANHAGGCGACGDSCRSRGSCRLADESPRPAAAPDHCEDARGMVCRCGPDRVSCPRGER